MLLLKLVNDTSTVTLCLHKSLCSTFLSNAFTSSLAQRSPTSSLRSLSTNGDVDASTYSRFSLRASSMSGHVLCRALVITFFMLCCRAKLAGEATALRASARLMLTCDMFITTVRTSCVKTKIGLYQPATDRKSSRTK